MQSQTGDREEILSIAAEAGEFSRATNWLESVCNAHGVPVDARYRLDICLDEALANVLAHGGEAARVVPIVLKLTPSGTPQAGTVWLTFHAGGIAFDPASHRTRPAPESLEEAEPGGLGILMMRSNAERIIYQRIGDANRTSFLVRWGAASGDDGGESAPPLASGN